MKIIDRYIALNLVSGFLLVLLFLVSLFSFMELMGQLDDVGKGNYRIVHAVVFVGLTAPRLMADLIPVSTLLGCILPLGLLDDGREILAMQSSGISVRRICASVLAASTLFIAAAIVLAEFIAPPLEQHARIRRSAAVYKPQVMMTESGFWTRAADSFIRVGRTLDGRTAMDIEVYRYDDSGRLQVYLHAHWAEIRETNHWILMDIVQKKFTERGIVTQQVPRLELKSFLSSEEVSILELPPDSLSISDLFGYVRILRERGQNADRYALALWQKLSLPLTTGAMVLLALGIIFRPVPRSTAGRKIIIGSLVGIAFYLINQICGYVGLLLDLPPSLTTLTPMVAVLWIAVHMLRRVL